MHLLQIVYLVVVKIPKRLTYLIFQFLAGLGRHPLLDMLTGNPIHGNDSLCAIFIVIAWKAKVRNVHAGF